MRFKLLIIALVTGLYTSAQHVNLKSFRWNLSSDTISVSDVDPSDVYLALLSKGVIDEPFYRDNEKKLQWVSKHEWTFETEFRLPDSILKKERIDLVFEGLDTYATVFFNGKQILKADNMFRRWEVDVKSLLKKHNNIKIVFKSPVTVINSIKKEGLWKLPYDYGYIRKAPYHFGWDWGPTFVTSGIWRPAYIRAWNKARFKDVYIRQKSVTKSRAEVEVNITMDASQNEKGSIMLFRNGELIQKRSVRLQPGENTFLIADEVNNPNLWWPDGLGEPTMYRYKVLYEMEDVLVDSMEVQTGFRTIEVVQKPDSAGRSFYFKVNGVPVFAKGANYIPPDNFLPRVTDAKYRQIITDAKNAHMNMLRVWGGGTYEKDIFYRLCDENGIMVWQDFMFACNMSPGDSAFMDNVKQEAAENVVRLRNHPSVALWCGNNEVDEAWHNWGWQKSLNYSVEDSAKLWHAYTNLFEKILPDVIKQYSPQTFYWPSSPSIGWGHKEAYQQGDAHYWEVWWGKAPFYYYEKKVGRFMSEYGFQGMPDIRTINDFTLPEDRVMGSKVLDVHQKHPFGWEAINEYMMRDFPVPTNLEDYDYVSQLLQAKGIGMAIEAHRRAKPYCMGTLYWQLNDCWPVVSWSSVDYYGRWKALHYRVKKDYAPLLISFDKTKDSIRIWVVSDEMKTRKATMQWTLMDFNGNILKSEKRDITLDANTSSVVDNLSRDLISAFDTTSILLNVKLLSGNSLLVQNNYFFTSPKNLNLVMPEINIEVQQQKEGCVVILKSDKLAKGVRLTTVVDGSFDDNYFDLLPDEKMNLFFKTTEVLTPDKLKIKTLFDVMKQP